MSTVKTVPHSALELCQGRYVLTRNSARCASHAEVIEVELSYSMPTNRFEYSPAG
jgi:hypothetical protein